jgi:hypothetical protein
MRPKEAPMSRKSLSTKLVGITLALSALAIALGSSPWGPN